MIELKPCPFCGATNIIHSLSFGWSHGVMCGKCGAEFTKCKTQEEAEKKWNRRVDNVKMRKLIRMAERMAERNEAYNLCEDASLYECSNCGESCSDTYYFDHPVFEYCPHCGAKIIAKSDLEQEG